MPGSPARGTGYLAIAGGALGLVLAPVMVTIKYLTGWDIIPEPGWVDAGRRAMEGLLRMATPQELWTAFGLGYTVALVLLLAAFTGLGRLLAKGGWQAAGYWTMLVGLALVVPGDAIHSVTWHQGGLATPTPGTNPLANTAYAVHMMGMNLVMAGSMVLGIAALRRASVARWLAWSFVLVFPSAVLASVTVLPTSPSGALWWFCLLMVTCGVLVVSGRARHVCGRRLAPG